MSTRRAFFRRLAWLLAGGVVALLAYAASRPDTFRVERAITVQAPPERVHPLINDLRRFNTWNPYLLKDPALQGTYSGAVAGPGAVYDFHGNQAVGRGRMAITEIRAPDSVTLQLDMFEPFEARNRVQFQLVPEGEGATRVTWSMDGASPFVTKLVGVFVDMDQMIGHDFEVGLFQLKSQAEKPATP